MSHFYLSARGKGPVDVTRTGFKHTGARAHVRGWNIGGKVTMSCRGDSGKDERDVVTVELTSGSNGYELAGFRASRPTKDGQIVIERFDPVLLAYLSDEAWTKLGEDMPKAVAQRLWQLLMVNLAEAQPA